ncbi:MAG TPA: dihydrofolate reductase family protein [Oligoflexus sp.]|uniref:dihydrofolate reductase family protein n=1 Tax=Oligoflexus sp. TaxID=1971216 RepID=UPI002D8022DD|nr:dihydrofolate reductase family protein [Oligoflexus sp.]HET9237283.1 dihydrofolate reductase family protein [Oligoflexus sp.]
MTTSGHVFIATSLDGYIARVDGDISWLLSRDDPAEDHGYESFIKDIDGIIMGRGTYEKVRDFPSWPYTRPVIVLSQSLKATDVPEALHGKVRVIDLQPRALMEKLSHEGWKRAYVDGGLVIQSFLRERLIDDLVITTVPVLIGQGRPLFGPLSSDLSLTLLDCKHFPSGLVQSRYRIMR